MSEFFPLAKQKPRQNLDDFHLAGCVSENDRFAQATSGAILSYERKAPKTTTFIFFGSITGADTLFFLFLARRAHKKRDRSALKVNHTRDYDC